jgi:hypothetical protein
VLLFEQEGEYLVAHGLDVATDRFFRGIDGVLANWLAQLDICKIPGSAWDAPNLEDKLVVSPDLLNAGSSVVEGVRYPYSSPNSGWWLFGREFSGVIETMKSIHLGHFTQSYGEVIEYLALEPGYCFRPGHPPRVWFEDEVAKRTPV